MTASLFTAPSINAAGPPDTDRIVAVLTLAFEADPAARWAFPNIDQYRTYWPQFVMAFAGAAFEHGTAHWAGDSHGDCAGAALWLPPGVHTDEDVLMSLLARSIPACDQAEAFATFDEMGAYHPKEPHWYLPLIGVDPIHQGRGLGSALMRHALARCDRERKPAFLESSNPRNVPLYERHGFELLGRIQVGASPTLFPMLRKAR